MLLAGRSAAAAACTSLQQQPTCTYAAGDVHWPSNMFVTELVIEQTDVASSSWKQVKDTRRVQSVFISDSPLVNWPGEQH